MHKSYLAKCAVQGKSRYIINSLLEEGYVTRPSLVYEACRQNYLELVKDLYTEEVEMHLCVSHAVGGEALDVLGWLIEKDDTLHPYISRQALSQTKVKVLRWSPREEVYKMDKNNLFFHACEAEEIDLFNFLLEIDYLPEEQDPQLFGELAISKHVQMVKTLVLERGWILDEQVFNDALEAGPPQILACLLSLGCPRSHPIDLYRTAKVENVYWLLDNLPPTEDILLDLCCVRGEEAIIIHLIENGLLPESFDDNSDITFAALEAGFTDAAYHYLEAGYTFDDNVCLQVTNSTSLAWLIENQVNLCPELYYKLVRKTDLSLLKKLEHKVDFPSDLLDYVFVLISEEASGGRFNTITIERLKQIVQWIKE